MKICKIVKMAKNHFQGGHWDLEDYQLTFFSPYRLIIDFLIQNVVQLKIRFSEQIDTPEELDARLRAWKKRRFNELLKGVTARVREEIKVAVMDQLVEDSMNS